VIDARTAFVEKEDQQQRIDLLQLMLDAATRGQVKVGSSIHSHDNKSGI